jgi:hypothetical protein
VKRLAVQISAAGGLEQTRIGLRDVRPDADFGPPYDECAHYHLHGVRAIPPLPAIA